MLHVTKMLYCNQVDCPTQPKEDSNDDLHWDEYRTLEFLAEGPKKTFILQGISGKFKTVCSREEFRQNAVSLHVLKVIDCLPNTTAKVWTKRICQTCRIYKPIKTTKTIEI